MSEALFNKDSWNRAFGPSLKALGYLSAGFLILYLLFIITFFLFSFIGLGEVITTIFSLLGPLILIFYFILVIFKVLDEELLSRQ